MSPKLARAAPINRLCCFAGNFLVPAVFGLYTLLSTHHSLIPTLGFRQLGCQQPAAAVETIRLQHPPLSFLLSPSFPSMPTFSLSFLLFSPSASSHHLRYIITTPMLPNRAPVRAYVVGGGGVGVVLLLPFLLLFFPSFPAFPSFFFSTSTTVLHYQIFMSTSCIIYYRYYRSPFFIAAATSSSFHSLAFWTSFSIASFSSFSTFLYNRLTSSLWLTVEPLLLLLIELAVVQQQQQQQLASKQPASQSASLPRIGSGC